MRQNWEVKKWGDVLEIKNGKSHKQVINSQGKFPIYGSGGIMGYSDDYICDEGTTIIGRKGSINNPIYVDKKLWNIDTAFGLSPLRCLNGKFLYYFCLSYDFTKHDKGTTLPSLTKKDLLANVFIPIPSIAEQERIVEILDEALTGIATIKANTERNLQNALELFQSYLNSIFSDKKKQVQSQCLESLCDLIVDCEHKTAPTQETGFPSIRTPNIGKGRLILDGVYRVSEDTYKLWTKRAIPQAGDLILAREAPAGNIAVIPENLKVCLGQRTVLIRPSKNIFISEFLMYLLLSENMQKLLLSHSKGTTVTHVNMKDIRQLSIHFVPSLQEQQKIVEKLDALSAETKKLETIYQQKLNDLEELKKSLLQKAFNGELTNPEKS